MILTGPSPVVVTPGNPAVRVRIIVDVDGGVISATYAPAGASGSKQVSHAIPPALVTALENWAQGAIETAEGWGAGTSTITTP